MNDLKNYFTTNTKNEIDKWEHYFDIYERHFSRYRGTDVNIVEIGISQGGSLQMWKDYFGPKATIYGIDINPQCKQFEEDQINIFIGDQTDRKFLQDVAKEIPKIDILIDDGGHEMQQQIISFEELFPHIDKDGIYLCEDLHTSYWKRYQGGHKRKNTFIEYSKDFIDSLHSLYTKKHNKPYFTDFSKSVDSLHYYDSVLVIQKRIKQVPVSKRTGNQMIPRYGSEKPLRFKFLRQVYNRLVQRDNFDTFRK